MMMQLGDPERALKGDDFYGMACRQVDHDRCAAATREPDPDHDSGRDLVIWPISEEGAARADRVQRARETYYDRVDLPERHEPAALDEALDVATRVRVTPEVLAAAEAATGVTIHDYDVDEMHRVLAAAFAAAGFEIEN